MALLDVVTGLFFAGGTQTKITGLPQQIALDAVITQQHSFRARITDSPVEDGSSINDHVILDPESLQIEGFISDHPVKLLGGALTAGLGAFSGETPTKTGMEALVAGYEARAELTIVTKIRTYDSMIIESLEIPRSRTTGESLRFSMTVRKIKKATLLTARVPSNRLANLGDQASGRVSNGRQSSRSANSSQSRGNRSVVAPLP